jgi:1-acyl-sn-glycerol-3-phosphate acyltransferase
MTPTQRRMTPADRVRSARSPALVALFGRYMCRYVARRVHGVRLARGTLPVLTPDRPAIIYTNHPSWWDPALFMVLATVLFGDRHSFGPMDAAALAKYRFMTRIGLFGIEPETPKGAAKFLRTGVGLLAQPNTLLWITAEGMFTDPRARPVRLRPGLAHLARRVEGVSIVPLALEYPFWTESTQEALLRFGPVMTGDAGRSVSEWNAALEAALTTAMDALAADAISRDPARFEAVLSGRAGIGGVYDLWRRARAAVRGERFRAEHG